MRHGYQDHRRQCRGDGCGACRVALNSGGVRGHPAWEPSPNDGHSVADHSRARKIRNYRCSSRT
ncbi:2Fe-2S iron-sulfur cluster-binding protein [Nocardia sp. NPDC052278]|uniref:2Fe-2S iron-sulfur cluster-binding protein n=1 Tax=Nocardia sp. NPDC052278 TaxID=3364328 RepID=UPI0037C5BC51